MTRGKFSLSSSNWGKTLGKSFLPVRWNYEVRRLDNKRGLIHLNKQYPSSQLVLFRVLLLSFGIAGRIILSSRKKKIIYSMRPSFCHLVFQTRLKSTAGCFQTFDFISEAQVSGYLKEMHNWVEFQKRHLRMCSVMAAKLEWTESVSDGCFEG